MRERGSVRKGMTPETDLKFYAVRSGGGTERTNVNVPLSAAAAASVSRPLHCTPYLLLATPRCFSASVVL